MSIIRGTTPTLEFVLPFETASLAEAFVTLSQNRTVKVDKTLADCERSQSKLTVRLTQEETLKLCGDCRTEIQIRAKTVDGEAIASNIMTVQTERILKDGVI